MNSLRVSIHGGRGPKSMTKILSRPAKARSKKQKANARHRVQKYSLPADKELIGKSGVSKGIFCRYKKILQGKGLL